MPFFESRRSSCVVKSRARETEAYGRVVCRLPMKLSNIITNVRRFHAGLPRQLRNPPRRPWGAAFVELFLDGGEIDFDQLVQAVEERTGLLLCDCECFAMRRRRRRGRRQSVHGGVDAIEQRWERRLVAASQNRIAIQ